MANDAGFAKLALRTPEFVRLALEGAGANLQTAIQVRVFPSDTQAVDANGVVVKNGEGYSPAYAEFRRKKGRQTAAIDLQLEGDLLRAYTNAITPDSYTILWNSSAQADKAERLERLFGQEIFAASNMETEQAYNDFERLFFQQLDANL